MKIDVKKSPENNIERAAQQIVLKMSSRNKSEIKRAIKRLNDCLYKSWAKDLTLYELLEVIELI